MSETSLRELGSKAKKSYGEDRLFAMQLEAIKRSTDLSVRFAKGDKKVIDGLKLAIEKPEGVMAKRLVSWCNTSEELQGSLETLTNNQLETLQQIGEYALERSILEDRRAVHNMKAARHYTENAAGYHELAVIEAQLDGVQINFSEPKA